MVTTMPSRHKDDNKQLTIDFSPNVHSNKSNQPKHRMPLTEPPKGLRFSRDHCLKALTDWSLFPKVLNIREASWLTQVPIKTLYKWSSEGKLKGIAKTIGKQLRFDRDALLRMWVNERKATK